MEFTSVHTGFQDQNYHGAGRTHTELVLVILIIKSCAL